MSLLPWRAPSSHYRIESPRGWTLCTFGTTRRAPPNVHSRPAAATRHCDRPRSRCGGGGQGCRSTAMTRRTRAVLTVMAVMAGAVAADAQTNALHLVSTPWPPFTSAPGQARYALDLVHVALQRAGVNAQTEIV